MLHDALVLSIHIYTLITSPSRALNVFQHLTLSVSGSDTRSGYKSRVSRHSSNPFPHTIQPQPLPALLNRRARPRVGSAVDEVVDVGGGPVYDEGLGGVEEGGGGVVSLLC